MVVGTAGTAAVVDRNARETGAKAWADTRSKAMRRKDLMVAVAVMILKRRQMGFESVILEVVLIVRHPLGY